MLTPVERDYVRRLAETYELRAWNRPPYDDHPAPGSLPHHDHVVHALALRLACGETPEEAHRHLLAARSKGLDPA
jgi:hypothetical protein